MKIGRFSNLLILFSVLTLKSVSCVTDDHDDVIVQITNGKIRGLRVENYYSFESIPYAEPPVGENRFEPPKPILTNWNDEIKNTTKEHPACLQWDHFEFYKVDKLVGAEDCLYLDVYTPSIQNDKKYPVVVYIHGGAFMFGAALNGWLRHDLIMKNANAVTVFFNYRLGPLGFMSTGDNEISGNFGLKDQRLALEWIHKNIAAFNGNPDKILLTGFSAGGASVHLQMLHPGLENLVSSAISFSGTALNPWVMVPHEVSVKRTQKLASSIDCNISDDTHALKLCLKSKPAEDIVRAVGVFHDFLYNPFRVFGPTIESKSVESPFMTEQPEKIIRDGMIANIPWIVSTSNSEGGYNAGELMKLDSNGELPNLKEFLEKFNELAPIVLFYNETLSNPEAVSANTNKLIETYKFMFDDTASINEKYFKIQEMFTDVLFHSDIMKSAYLHTEFSKSPVYGYLYDNPAPFGCASILSNRTDIDFGTVHGDDVFLIFNLPLRDEYAFRPDEIQISNNLIDMVINFAITNTVKYDNMEIPKNEKNSGKLTYLKITRTNIMVESLQFI